jgi:hypothetical protein
MAAKKKKTKPTARKAKKKAGARRSKAAPHITPPRPTAAPAELKELDSEWRSFIRKSAPDIPLTEMWEAPTGAPSTKTVISKAAVKKAKKKAAKKASKKKTTKKKTAKKKAGAKAPARNKAKK